MIVLPLIVILFMEYHTYEELRQVSKSFFVTVIVEYHTYEELRHILNFVCLHSKQEYHTYEELRLFQIAITVFSSSGVPYL